MGESEKNNMNSKTQPSRPPKSLRLAEEQLRAEHKRLLAKLAADSTSPDELMDGWQDRDSAAEDELRDVEFEHRGAIREKLLKVEWALERLRAGTFGICVDCNTRIDPKRLSQEPGVSLCVTCQAATEGEAAPTL